MKKLKLTAILLCLAILAACSESEPETAAPNISEEPGEFIDDTIVNILDVMNNVDDYRRFSGSSDEDVFDWMFGLYTADDRADNIILHIITVTAVEVIRGAEGIEGMVSSPGMSAHVEYLLKITDNLTGHDIPEYINLTSRFGDIFEIGKEYVIMPFHRNTTLADLRYVNHWYQVISRDFVSESNIERIRNAGEIRRRTIHAEPRSVIEHASLSQTFLAGVDLVVEITVTDKWVHDLSDSVFFVRRELNEVIYFKDEHRDLLAILLHPDRPFLVNFDVEIGGTYIVMLNVVAEDSLIIAARNGAVVPVRSPEFAQYREAFAELAAS
jgi:hypothetical protein